MTNQSDTDPSTEILTISARELLARLGDDDLTVVDVRPIAAFNGWRLAGETCGGHIPGAVAFPSAWLDTVDEAEIERELRQKGVAQGRNIVIYDDGAGDAARVAAKLVTLGIAAPAILDGGWPAWADARDAPVERLANHEKLVHTHWLRAVLDGRRPEAAPSGRWLLFHVNFGVPEEYEEGHLPGALYLDTNWLEDPADWNRRTPDELEAALRALGISHDTTVILYGRDTEGQANEKWPGRRAGQIAATRAGLILRYAGVDDIRVLDGGYDHWVRAGGALETTQREPSPVASFGVTIPQRPELIIDIGEAKEMLAEQAGAALVSVRTWREHIGAVSGYNYIGPAGRILRRCVGQLRHRRLSHAALPDGRQHDAAVPRDRGQLGRGGHHARQMGRLLLRYGLAGQRDVVLRLSHGLAADRGL